MQTIINAFINDPKISVVGVSTDKSKWGYSLFKALSDKGYTVYPVNPKYSFIDGIKCYASVADLPPDVSNVILAISQSWTDAVVNEMVNSSIKRVWFHKGAGGIGSMTESALHICGENKIEVVFGLCPMMFFPPVGIHKVHLWIKKITHTLPVGLKL